MPWGFRATCCRNMSASVRLPARCVTGMASGVCGMSTSCSDGSLCQASELARDVLFDGYTGFLDDGIPKRQVCLDDFTQFRSGRADWREAPAEQLIADLRRLDDPGHGLADLLG